MPKSNITTRLNFIHPDLFLVKNIVYDQSGFELLNLIQNEESKDYGACTYELNEIKIVQRIAKITPKKTGQFVTLWKRNKNNITEPHDYLDDFDFVIIIVKNASNFGQFIFPKSVLADKGIISKNGIEGKRGFRVYPPWVKTTNKQAEKTQNWQINYFLTIDLEGTQDLSWMKWIFTFSSENT